jgi:hypothetical protein
MLLMEGPRTVARMQPIDLDRHSTAFSALESTYHIWHSAWHCGIANARQELTGTANCHLRLLQPKVWLACYIPSVLCVGGWYRRTFREPLSIAIQHGLHLLQAGGEEKDRQHQSPDEQN